MHFPSLKLSLQELFSGENQNSSDDTAHRRKVFTDKNRILLRNNARLQDSEELNKTMSVDRFTSAWCVQADKRRHHPA